jgi:diguanylate cyclase (GGDEF)-like protein
VVGVQPVVVVGGLSSPDRRTQDVPVSAGERKFCRVVPRKGAMDRTRRSPEVLALAAFLGGAIACLAAGAAFPMSPEAPVALGLAMIPVALAMLALTLLGGARLPRWALLAQAVVATVLNSVLVANAHTTGGAIGDALAYVWLTIYVALFFPAAATAFAALVTGGFGLGLLAGGLPDMVAPWLIVAVTVFMLGEVLSRVSRAAQGRMATDLLTGALNRGGLHDAAERVTRRSRRRTEALAVAALDLDGFKEINDQRGHATGDRLLAEASAAWRAALRREDVLARTGGDEFVLLLPNTSQEEAAAILARVREAHPVAWSAGVTDWRADDTLESCLERADRRLYAAKSTR